MFRTWIWPLHRMEIASRSSWRIGASDWHGLTAQPVIRRRCCRHSHARHSSSHIPGGPRRRAHLDGGTGTQASPQAAAGGSRCAELVSRIWKAGPSGAAASGASSSTASDSSSLLLSRNSSKSLSSSPYPAMSADFN